MTSLVPGNLKRETAEERPNHLVRRCPVDASRPVMIETADPVMFDPSILLARVVYEVSEGARGGFA